MGGAESFIAEVGTPNPPAPVGVPDDAHLMWPIYRKKIGAGFFLDRFLYLFGEGVERLEECLEAWSFLVPPVEDRVILGYNAYGAILVLEHGQDADREMVKVLNPLTVQYWGDRNLTFGSLIGSWLPERRIPRFFDTSVYEEHREEHGDLDPFEILGIGVPLTLDGKMELDNFARQDIVAYYRDAAPAYKKAFAKMKR